MWISDDFCGVLTEVYWSCILIVAVATQLIFSRTARVDTKNSKAFLNIAKTLKEGSTQMAAVVKVVEKNSEIDGKPIKWQVLSIIGFLSGDYQTLELKLTKTEAMLAKLLLSSDESKPVVETRKSNEDEQPTINKTKTILDDDEDGKLFD